MVNSVARIIKKYPNRRLYDTETSTYITLSDVKTLVFSFENFKVVEAKTDEDITRNILLQIVLEEESGGLPLFSTELLSRMIRFYGHAMQAALAKYLETNITAFGEFQQRLQEHSKNRDGDNHSIHAELWSQFLNFQGPAMQNMIYAYVGQGRKMSQTMQEQSDTQMHSVFSGFQFPRYPKRSFDPTAAQPSDRRSQARQTQTTATDDRAQQQPMPKTVPAADGKQKTEK